jgi:hypothetical protein
MLPTLPLVAALLLPHARAACPADLAVLRQDMGQARMAYADEDLEALRQAVERVDEDLSCLSEQVTPDDALQAHMVHALGWWLLRDEERVAFALRGALAIDPAFIPGDDIAPAGSRLMAIFTQVREQGPGISAPANGKLILDGFEGLRALPMQRAALLQRREEGELKTWYSEPDGPPSGLVDEAPFGWVSEGLIMRQVLGEQMVLAELRRMADQGQHPSWIAARLNEKGLQKGAQPWSTRSVREQLELDEQGGLRHTRQRRRAADEVTITPELEAPE